MFSKQVFCCGSDVCLFILPVMCCVERGGERDDPRKSWGSATNHEQFPRRTFLRIGLEKSSWFGVFYRAMNESSVWRSCDIRGKKWQMLGKFLRTILASCAILKHSIYSETGSFVFESAVRGVDFFTVRQVDYMSFLSYCIFSVSVLYTLLPTKTSAS